MMRSRGMGAGSISLVLIFSALCLTIFAVLSLISANNEKKLAEKLADTTINYYSADTAATAVMAEVDRLLAEGKAPTREIGGVTLYSAEADGAEYFSYICPIDDSRGIAVTLKYADGALTVMGWKATVADGWEADDSLVVWQGD